MGDRHKSWLKIVAAAIIAGGAVVGAVIQSRSALEAARIQAEAKASPSQDDKPPVEVLPPVEPGTEPPGAQPPADPPDGEPSNDPPDEEGDMPEEPPRKQPDRARNTTSGREEAFDVVAEEDRRVQRPARCSAMTVEIWPGSPRSICNDSVALDVAFAQERGVEFATVTAVDALGKTRSLPVMGNRGSLRVESDSGTVVLSVFSVDWRLQHLKLRVTPVGDR